MTLRAARLRDPGTRFRPASGRWLSLLILFFAWSADAGPLGTIDQLIDHEDPYAAAPLLQALSPAEADSAEGRRLRGMQLFLLGSYDSAATELGQVLDAADDTLRVVRGAADMARGTVVEESAHFALRYHPGKDALLVPYALDTLEKAYEALSSDLDYRPPGRIRVELLSSPRELARVSSLPEHAIRTTGTIALCKYNRLMFTTPRAMWHGYEWLDTVAHELTHYFVNLKGRGAVPIWLHEGLARYLESRWRGPAGGAIDPGAEALLVRGLRQNKLVSFERMSPSIALLPSAEEAALAFAEVASFIQFLDQKRGVAGLRTLLSAMGRGASDKVAVAQAAGMPFGSFESAWRGSLKDRPARASPIVKRMIFQDEHLDSLKKGHDKAGQRSYDRGELGTIPDPEARRHAHLGELLRDRGRLAAALREYRTALDRAGPGHAPLARRYATTLKLLGKGAEAESTLQQSLRIDPSDTTNHKLLGQILVDSGRAAEALGHFEWAVRKDPFDPELHSAWKTAAQTAGLPQVQDRESRVLSILQGARKTWNGESPPDGAGGTGFLRIEAPAGARVVIDGTDTGLTVPVAEMPLPAGRHRVRLEPPSVDQAPAVVSLEGSIEVPNGELVGFVPAGPQSPSDAPSSQP